MKKSWIGLLLVLALALAACGTEDPATPPVADADLDAKPEITVPQGDPPTELVIEDLVVGDGPEAEEGSNVVVHYVGASWSTGDEFDASWDRGQPFPFTVGQPGLIDGWGEGLPGMREGGRRQLIIPPDMGYGEVGRPPAIAPNETLIFVIDLLEVQP